MSFLTVLYTLILSPLELLFEVVFTIANRIIGNPGLSIIFLSLAFNFLVLPLYKRADELQAEERDIQAKMAPRLKRIKSTFKGDERFFMIQEYYRINHYKPIYQLKSSVSLLLQIPFFIAAYRLLSRMQCLQGMQFGFIADLGKEDATFMIGSFPVNILPVLMTLINIVSGIIYTKGHPLKSKIQVYGLALVFLVLLYHSPSGLVFYWLLNNVFSLVKNIFYKLKDPKKAVYILFAAAGIGITVMTFVKPGLDLRQKILLWAGALLLIMPLVSLKIRFKKISDVASAGKNDYGLFFSGAVLMALISGVLIPSAVINDSPQEFIDVVNPYNPFLYIVNSGVLAFGSFVLWGSIFYFFMSGKAKSVFSKAMWICCGVSVIDYMLFGTKLGTMNSALQYDKAPAFRVSDYVLNILAVLAVTVLFAFVVIRFRKIAKTVIIIGILTVIVIGAFNSAAIISNYKEYSGRTEASEMPVIPLSRNGKNVIVLMLDRSEGLQIPYIFNEKPELKDQFDGFTYYPNTNSYGQSTIVGSPALYGGYEYTPQKLNERPDEALKDKHNEALKVMPVLFSRNGYNVTVIDPSYANYQEIPDLSIYDGYPNINRYLAQGKYSIFSDNENFAGSERLKSTLNRNLFCFSLMKSAPVILQETLYNGGLYNGSDLSSDSQAGAVTASSLIQYVSGISRSKGYLKSFIECYAVLLNLDEMTSISDGSENNFLMMANDTTHSACLLQQPDYVPQYNVDNTAYDVDMESRYTVNGVTMNMSEQYPVIHYHANMATFIQLGKWFDYLREQGVWDNTRIILVSDHARGLGQFNITCEGQDMEFYFPLLMVKDFNSTGFNVSQESMTNADTPVIATNGLIKDPTNPFTGNPINSDPKFGIRYIYYTDFISAADNSGNTFEHGKWYRLDGDPHDPASWKYVGEKLP